MLLMVRIIAKKDNDLSRDEIGNDINDGDDNGMYSK